MSKFSLDTPNNVDAGFFFRPISPSAFTRKPMDLTKNLGCQFTDTNKPALFEFGNCQSDAEQKFEKKFNFVLNVEKSDEFNSDAEKNITSVIEMESKLNVDKLTTFGDPTIEDTNEKCATQVRDKESNQQKQTSDEGMEKADEEISIKILFKEFKEMINEFSKERAEYEKRITALETRIEALELRRKLEKDDISSTVKDDEGHDTASMNCTKDMPVAIQSLPVAIPSFISPQATIFGSTPLFSSATAQKPTNFVFGATAFPSKSTSTTELLIPNRQFNNSPSSLGTPVVHTNFLSNTGSTISKEINSKGKENSHLLFVNKQINAATSFANKENEEIDTSLKVNEGLENKKQTTSNLPHYLEQKTNQKLEGPPNLDNFKKSIEESFQKALRDIFSELKETLANAYEKKD